MTDATQETARFPCTPRGAVAAGHRTLAWLLLGLAAVMVVVGVLVFIADRLLPSLLCLAIAFALWTTWRMSGDLDLVWLEVERDRLTVQMKSQRLHLPLLAPTVRALDAAEREHTERLASNGLLVAGTGGFDSHLLGEFNLHATDLDNAVLVETGDTRVVVTPDDPEGFITAFREASA